MQFIPPHLSFETLNAIGFDRSMHTLHNYAVEQYKQSNYTERCNQTFNNNSDWIHENIEAKKQ